MLIYVTEVTLYIFDIQDQDYDNNFREVYFCLALNSSMNFL